MFNVIILFWEYFLWSRKIKNILEKEIAIYLIWRKLGIWREEGGESGNIALFTWKLENTPNMKMKYGQQKRIQRRERNKKDVTPT